jgi:hypothetical protein
MLLMSLDSCAGRPNISIEDGISSAFGHAHCATRVRKGGLCRVLTI